MTGLGRGAGKQCKKKSKSKCYLSIISSLSYLSVPVVQWLEHCVSSAKVVGLIPREHMY